MEKSLKTAQELKKVTEKSIFDVCNKFEEDTGLKISRIAHLEVEPYLPSKERLKPKLVGIELTVEL